MSLTDDARSEATIKGPPCGVAVLRDSMPPKVRGELDALLGDRTIPATALSRALNKHGHSINPSPLQRHRKGECACGTR